MSAVAVPKLSGVDFITDPQVLQQQLQLLYGLRNLNVQLVVRTGSNSLAPAQSQIIGSPPNLVLPLPLLISGPIADSTATAASVSATLNLLLAAMRLRGDLPR